jgi:hypothetical protein
MDELFRQPLPNTTVVMILLLAMIALAFGFMGVLQLIYLYLKKKEEKEQQEEDAKAQLQLEQWLQEQRNGRGGVLRCASGGGSSLRKDDGEKHTAMQRNTGGGI